MVVGDNDFAALSTAPAQEMCSYIFFPVLVQTWRTCVTGTAGRSCESNYMQIDQVLGSQLRERQVTKMVGDQFASPYAARDLPWQWRVLSLLAAESSVVFFELYV